MKMTMKRMTTLWGALVLTARPSWGCVRSTSRTPFFAVAMSTAAVVPNRFRTVPGNRKRSLFVQPLRLKNNFSSEDSSETVKADDDSTRRTNTTSTTDEESIDSRLPLDPSERETIKKIIDEKDPSWKDKGKRLQRSIEQGWRRGIADAFSVAGFVSSAATNLWFDRSQFDRLQPTIQAFRDYLKTTEIDLEITKALSVRLLGNILALREIQQYLSPGDRREEALKNEASKDLPTEEESYR